MDECVVCQRKVQRTENYLRRQLWGAIAMSHWQCFGAYLRSESGQQVEGAVWKAGSLTKSN